MVSIGNKFLVTGGFLDGGDTTTASAEIYDPVTNAWTATPNMVSARILHTAITLCDGRVLVAGGTAAWGSCDATTQIYNIATNSWTSGPSLSTVRCYASADLLPDGKVLVAGGSTWGPVVSSTELFDPATNTWTASAPMTEGRYQHTSAVLPDGRLVLAGGQKQWGVATATTERFYADVHDGVQWRSLGDLPAARYAHSMTPLTPTSVLLAGGYNNSTTTADAQILNLDEAPPGPCTNGVSCTTDAQCTQGFCRSDGCCEVIH
jgi:Kelch motif protein